MFLTLKSLPTYRGQPSRECTSHFWASKCPPIYSGAYSRVYKGFLSMIKFPVTLAGAPFREIMPSPTQFILPL